MLHIIVSYGHDRADEWLRVVCLSGAVALNEYLRQIMGVGFGTVEVCGRRPYLVLDASRYDVDEDILLETVELAAYKDPMPADGPCVLPGQVSVRYRRRTVL